MADKKAVALALVGTFILLMADEGLVRKSAPAPKKLVGFAVAFLMLGFLAEIESTAKLAKWFSILVFVSTFVKLGPAVWTQGSKAVAVTKPKAARSPRRISPPTHG